MSYNASNYTEQGGATTVIGGELEIVSGGKITAAGTQAAAITNVATAGSATAAANATAINSILAALRGAGIIASS
jgi:hypothetical protein